MSGRNATRGSMLYLSHMILPHDQLRRHLERVYAAAYPDGPDFAFIVEPTADPKHGEYTTTAAMKLGPLLKEAPRDVAQNLLAKLGPIPMLEKAEVVGPGFLNFFLKPAWLVKQADAILTDRYYGQSNIGKNRTFVVEYISANPTGPLTLANGRGAFAGEVMANLLTKTGWKVVREYYVNDIGNQVNVLAESVIRRYFQAQGIPTDYPDHCYQGDYVTELAKKLKLETMKLKDMTTIRDRIKGRVLETMLNEIKRVVEKKLKVHFDRWQRESALVTSKLDQKALTHLRAHDLLVEKDGATWFRTTAYGDDKDRVLIKQGGETTYFLSDIALRYYRFLVRGVDRELLYLGADHHGYVPRLNAAMAALGVAKQLDVAIVQMVKLMRGGQEVRMSKRAGNYVPIEDVVDEVGLDATRFFFLMHAADTHMDFNLDLAKEHSEKNPVYYVQYAHARIASLLKKVGKSATKQDVEPPHASEIRLVKLLLEQPRLIAGVAESRETQKLPFYAMELARAFHEFYTNCRVIDEGVVWSRRLTIVKATQKVLADTLAIMGVSAPTSM